MTVLPEESDQTRLTTTAPPMVAAIPPEASAPPVDPPPVGGAPRLMSVDYVLITQVLPSSAEAANDLGIINITATLPTTVAAGAASLVITVLGGYTALFPIAAAAALLGGLLLIPIRSVR